MYRRPTSFCTRSRAPMARIRPTVAKRGLKLHEYQSQQLLKQNGLPIARGTIAHSAEEAAVAARTWFDLLGPQELVLKSQVLAGGRGKGHFTSGLQGGVQFASTVESVKDYASKMLGHRLITKQTGAEGKPVNVLYMVEKMNVVKETYLAFVLDRVTKVSPVLMDLGPVLLASAEGGMDIEAVAAATPDKLVRVPIDPATGLTQETALDVAGRIGFKDAARQSAASQLVRLYEIFWKNDATLVGNGPRGGVVASSGENDSYPPEINPFAQLADGQVMCLDAKFNFDTNALYRHKDLAALKDITQEDPRDVVAAKFDINYIGLSGNIGCLVNGAGLAMATMDIIKLHGGDPANFLDIGGGASTDQVREAFKILNSDENVKAILVNIFGGIMRCDIIAQGIVEACRSLTLRVPVVVRLQGTNFEEGKEILERSGLRLKVDDNLDNAASTVVSIARHSTHKSDPLDFSIPL